MAVCSGNVTVDDHDKCMIVRPVGYCLHYPYCMSRLPAFEVEQEIEVCLACRHNDDLLYPEHDYCDGCTTIRAAAATVGSDSSDVQPSQHTFTDIARGH